MRKPTLLAWAAGLALGAFVSAGGAFAAGDADHPKQELWSFSGIFGTYDRGSVQRGFQVYKEVCSACHAMSLLSYRNLQQIGFSEDAVKAIAAEVEVRDGPNDQGEMFLRPGRPSDRFRKPFENEQAARAGNNGAYPPDLSLMAKARQDGPNYLAALLTGYSDPPPGFNLPDGMYYNRYFPGRQIAMAPPLSNGAVTYADGTAASAQQMAKDVTYFMNWAAEPELERRKRLGVQSILFLLVLTGMLYAVKRKVWADVH
jgi:ubiquinol-cytochrome c reductase cytochrome c1 subunit